jgi:hypothetical protein
MTHGLTHIADSLDELARELEALGLEQWDVLNINRAAASLRRAHALMRADTPAEGLTTTDTHVRTVRSASAVAERDTRSPAARARAYRQRLGDEGRARNRDRMRRSRADKRKRGRRHSADIAPTVH